MKYLYKLLLTLIAFVYLNSCSVNPVSGNQDFVLFSEERELEIGRSYNAQILQNEKVYADKKLPIIDRENQ